MLDYRNPGKGELEFLKDEVIFIQGRKDIF